jgi:alpha-D-ribose 1-methylphosphonate 5-triphosphate synthase subunit PhnH
MTASVTAPDLPGFADPAADSQACFRAVLEALSEPGRIVPVGGSLRTPAPLGIAAGAVLLTLADRDTPLWIDPALAEARPWIGFHAGVPAATPEGAAFGLCAGLPELDAFPAGSDEVPEAGATLVVQINALEGGPPLLLSGPGLRVPTAFAPALPAGFAARWAANHARFPRGVDLLLCAGDRLAALPRSTRVEAG